MPNFTDASALTSSSTSGHLNHNHNSTALLYYHAQFKKKHKDSNSDFNQYYESDDRHINLIQSDINNNAKSTHFAATLSSAPSFSPEVTYQPTNLQTSSVNIYRVLIFTESFHPYTSGIARRLKEILKRLSKRKCFLIHVVTGCKVKLLVYK
jgi:hypothetical protein